MVSTKRDFEESAVSSDVGTEGLEIAHGFL
jgi:hypothetical protein